MPEIQEVIPDNKGGAPKGNNNAGKNKPWQDVLRRAMLQDDRQRLRQAAEMLLDKAAEGDLNAIKELADRLDGKSKQAVEHTGADEGPIKVEHKTPLDFAGVLNKLG